MKRSQLSTLVNTKMNILVAVELSAVTLALIETGKANPEKIYKSSQVTTCSALMTAILHDLQEVAQVLVNLDKSNKHAFFCFWYAINHNMEDVAIAIIETGIFVFGNRIGIKLLEDIVTHNMSNLLAMLIESKMITIEVLCEYDTDLAKILLNPIHDCIEIDI